MTHLIPEILGAESIPSLVVVDRAHLSLAPNPKKGVWPRPIIIWLHYYEQKEKTVGLAKGDVTFQGTLPVHIYPDLSAEISKLRFTFNVVKVKLQEAKIDYNLYYFYQA